MAQRTERPDSKAKGSGVRPSRLSVYARFRLERYASRSRGYASRSRRRIASRSDFNARAWASNAPSRDGRRLACLIQTTCTCPGASPARVIRSHRTFQGSSDSTQSSAAFPPWAPSTMTSRGFRARSASARRRNATNSWDVFDIPIETSPMRPFSWSSAPSASRGTTRVRAISIPAASCSRGLVLALPG